MDWGKLLMIYSKTEIGTQEKTRPTGAIFQSKRIPSCGVERLPSTHGSIREIRVQDF